MAQTPILFDHVPERLICLQNHPMYLEAANAQIFVPMEKDTNEYSDDKKEY